MYLFGSFEKYSKYIYIIYIICSILSYKYLGKHPDGRIALLWIAFVILVIVHFFEGVVKKYFKLYKILYINVILSISIALLLYFIFTNSLQIYVVKTSSMKPTIYPKNLVFVNKKACRSKEPQRNDVVLFRTDLSSTVPLIHRIIACQNDIVRITDGAVTINEERIDFNTLDTFESKTIVVPIGAYYQKGDNPNSYLGIVYPNQILGKIIYIAGDGPKSYHAKVELPAGN